MHLWLVVSMMACSTKTPDDGVDPTSETGTVVDTSPYTPTSLPTGTDTGTVPDEPCVPTNPRVVQTSEPRLEVAGSPEVDGLAADVAALGASLLQFADDGGETNRNTVVSPVSLAGLLTMLAIDAQPPFSTELDGVFASAPTTTWADAYAAYSVDTLAPPADRHAVVQHGRAVFYAAPPQEPWTSTATAHGVHLEPVDFAADPEAARQHINRWVEEHTACMIPDLLQPPMPQAATQVAVVDALAVAALWGAELSDERLEAFTLADGKEAQVTTAYGNTVVGRMTVGDVEVVVLPTRDPSWSLRIVLPSAKTSADDLVATLDGPTLASWSEVAPAEGVELHLPILELSTRLNLVDASPSLGIPSLFTQAGWGSLCPTCAGEGAAHQQVNVSVDGEGFRAAAASVATDVDSGAPPLPELRIDHPFLMMVVDEAAHVPWFVGVVRDPLSP